MCFSALNFTYCFLWVLSFNFLIKSHCLAKRWQKMTSNNKPCHIMSYTIHIYTIKCGIDGIDTHSSILNQIFAGIFILILQRNKICLHNSTEAQWKMFNTNKILILKRMPSKCNGPSITYENVAKHLNGRTVTQLLPL